MATRPITTTAIARPEEDIMSEERLTITVAEAAKLLGISRGTAYECVRTGQIPSVCFGRRVLIPRKRFEAMLDAEQGAA